MQPDERDLAFLWDMREAALDARSIAEGLTLERFRSARKDQLALAKAVELIGEAASRVSQEYRDAHPEIPWSAIVGMRHRLVHDYRRIDLRRLWDVAGSDIDPLLATLDRLVPPPPRED